MGGVFTQAGHETDSCPLYQLRKQMHFSSESCASNGAPAKTTPCRLAYFVINGVDRWTKVLVEDRRSASGLSTPVRCADLNFPVIPIIIIAAPSGVSLRLSILEGRQ
jgi:hypothetical protein